MNIYLSPEAQMAARVAFGNTLTSGFIDSNVAACIEASLVAAIQYIVENPKNLSHKERAELKKKWAKEERSATNDDWQVAFAESLRLAFTAPKPEVPEKLVAVIDKHTALATAKGGWTPDMIRDLACESAAVSK